MIASLCVLLALVPCLANGLLLLDSFAPRLQSDGLVRVGLAMILGASATSIVCFLALTCVGVADHITIIGAELCLLAALLSLDAVRIGHVRRTALVVAGAVGVALWMPTLGVVVLAGYACGRVLFAGSRSCGVDERSLTARRFATALFVVLCVLVVLSIPVVVVGQLRSPHGGGDSVAIWNLRARMLFESGSRWVDAFTQEAPESHPDYPLLLPLLVARTWEWVGERSPASPIAIASWFTAAGVTLVIGALRVLRGPIAGWLGGCAIVGFPVWIGIGTAQYADLPLSVFVLGAFAAIAIGSTYPADRWRWHVLAGLCLGSVSWTKNEGQLFTAVFLAVWGASVLWQRKNLYRQMAPLLLGALPVWAVLGLFKITLSPTNDLVAQIGSDAMWARVTDLSRYRAILAVFPVKIWQMGPPVLCALAVYGVVVRRDRLYLPLLTGVAAVPCYASVYLLTSVDIEWHLDTSSQRLFLQLLPAIVFSICSARHGLEPCPTQSEKR